MARDDDPRNNAAPEERRRGNLRLGLILASIAAAFFLGFVAKMFLLGG
ncbi:cytochrome oxidase small assembly protein [Ramlibacter rhizophilus]|nr:cytochrome oxidase small assembly protein [Ramlibacter rhizophilus]